MEARADGRRAHQLVDRLGRLHSLHGPEAERAREDVAFHERERLRRQQDRPGHRHLLHAGSEVCRLPDGGVVHVEVAADRAHHDFSGVQPDPDVHGDAQCAVDLLRVLPDALLHAQRGIAGAHRVLLVRDGRAEERHHAVAQHLVDRALVVVDRLDHALEHRVQQAPRILGVAIGQQLHRTLEIREQHGHVLALALQRILRRSDALGEMRRRVRGRRGEARRRGAGVAGRQHRRRGHGGGTFGTELRARGELALALGAPRRQRGSALGTELGPRRRLVPAAGALHGP
jgi:hypothetical protein